MRQLLLLIVISIIGTAHAETPIMGEPEIDARSMTEFIRRHNPNFDSEIAEAYYNIGCRYGVRGDIAICQAILETGWFQFSSGTAVTADQHNYCGLGVTEALSRGATFATIEEGVTAQIQHLYAYASRRGLPDGETVVDPRYTYVPRGVAPTWESLSGRWAVNKEYGNRILNLYYTMTGRIIEVIEVQIPDDLLNF